jgi:minor extracellular serine protease Vpr
MKYGYVMVWALALATLEAGAATLVTPLERMLDRPAEAWAPLIPLYAVDVVQDEVELGLFFRMAPGGDPSQLEALGVKVDSRLPGGICTGRANPSALGLLKAAECVQSVELAGVSRTRLNISRPSCGAEAVHTELGLRGQGVVVGVIDSGIDVDHPDFWRADGTCRILEVWDQGAVGTPPPGYSYGQHWNTAQIQNHQCTQVDEDNHGTHVAGTAAGGGRATNPLANFTGIAPESEIIFVKMTGDDNMILDGANWIFQRAAALGRPCVINMSLGGHMGPHDGTALYDQGMTALGGPGRLLVAAAGNEGEKLIHLSAIVDAEGGPAILVPQTDTPGLMVDGWAEADSPLALEIAVLNPSNGDVLFTSPSVQPGALWEGNWNGLDLGIDQLETNNPQNGDRHFQLQAGGAGYTNYLYGISFAAQGVAEASFHAWEITDGATVFTNEVEWAIPGDNLYTVGSPAVAQGVLAVAAHNTRNSYPDVNGQLQVNEDILIGDRAGFSSIGPTRDGRLKPEISAPGQLIAAALTSDGDQSGARVLQHGWYHVLEGTSMATPHVTGACALLLGLEPELAPEDLPILFGLTATMDGFTGTVPNLGWGWGKMDVAAAAALLALDVPTPTTTPHAFRLLGAHPNPFNPTTTLELELLQSGDLDMRLVDLVGRTVWRHQGHVSPGLHQVHVDGSGLASGLYLVQAQFGGEAATSKILLIK